MPKVRFLETINGSPDGITVVTYGKDQIATIPDDLYRNFKEMGVIERVNEKSETTIENKAEQNVTENKEVGDAQIEAPAVATNDAKRGKGK